MYMVNGAEGAMSSEPLNPESLNVRKQRGMKFSHYSNQPRIYSKESDASSLSTNHVSSAASQLPPGPLSTRDERMWSRDQRPHTVTAGAMVDGRSHAQPPQAHGQILRERRSEASRLRSLNNEYRSLSSDGRKSPETLMPSTRKNSKRRRKESPRPNIHTANTFPLQAHDEERPSYVVADEPRERERGVSISSVQITSHQSAIPLRPYMSIPDYHAPDSIYSRQRNLTNANFKSGRGIPRPDSNYSSHRREPATRPAGFDNDEVRASFRSALTTTSSFLGTSGTERSSVITKSSSATSIYGRDEGMSVDDAIGMYESGFQDSGVEDHDDLRPGTADSRGRNIASRPGTASSRAMAIALRPGSADSHEKQAREPGQAMREDLAPPKMLASFPMIRNSEAFFKPGMIDTPSTVDSIGLDGPSDTREGYFGRRPSTKSTARRLMTESDPSRDRYGFKKKTQYISLEKYEAWNESYTEHLARRSKKWVVLLKDNGLITDRPERFPPKSPRVKRFIRKGIPPDWRGAAWFYYAGGPAMVAKHYGVYDDLVRKAENGGVTETDDEIIERDLNRTFPDNIKFKPDQPDGEAQDPSHEYPETPLLQSLRRVLQAFSIYNPKIGYCQSLNFLVGLLLLFMDEERSFWMLNIITRVYLPGTHEVNLEGANVDLGVLMSAIKDMMPSVWAKVGGELDGSPFSSSTMRLPPITLCTTAWFMSCFIGTLPIETTLRVWDSFFYEGSKTLFRIALTIFKVGETEIKSVTDPMEIFQVVQTIPRRLIDANALMNACFKKRNGFGHLSQEAIEKGRAERRRGYAAERAAAEGGLAAENVSSPARKGTLFGRKKRDIS